MKYFFFLNVKNIFGTLIIYHLNSKKKISIDYVGKIIGSTPEKDLENVFDSMSQTCKINLTNFLIHNRLKEGMLQKNYLMSHIHKNHIGVLNAAISTIQVIV